jgi:DNA-binding NarL/FixJ family response regulator
MLRDERMHRSFFDNDCKINYYTHTKKSDCQTTEERSMMRDGLEVFAKARCTVWLADDNESVLGALKGLLHAQMRGMQIGTFCSADALIQQLQQKSGMQDIPAAAKRREPDIIFLDQSMPGTGGIEAISSILQHAPSVKIIMLTNYDFPRFVERAFQQGVYGYMLKSSDPQLFVGAMQSVLQGKKYIDPSIAEDVLKLAGLQPAMDGVI